MLTDAQRAAYDRDGFIVVPDVFPADEVAELRRVTDEFVAALGDGDRQRRGLRSRGHALGGRAAGAADEDAACDPSGLHARQPQPQDPGNPDGAVGQRPRSTPPSST